MNSEHPILTNVTFGVNFATIGVSLANVKEWLQILLLLASLVLTITTIYFKVKSKGRAPSGSE